MDEGTNERKGFMLINIIVLTAALLGLEVGTATAVVIPCGGDAECITLNPHIDDDGTVTETDGSTSCIVASPCDYAADGRAWGEPHVDIDPIWIDPPWLD